MPEIEYLRVKDRDTGHEYSVVASAFNADAHERLEKPAVSCDGTPLPPKHNVPLGGLSNIKPTNATQADEPGTTSEKEGA